MLATEEKTKRVFTDKKDFPLSLIKEMFDDGDIIPQPDYQRDYVMDNKTASRLIESVLLNIPIPTVFCVKNLTEDLVLLMDSKE